MNKDEIYKPVEGWDDIYEVSNMGNIRNLITGKLKKFQKNNRGYLVVQFERLHIKKTFFVHRIVALCFCKRDNDSLVVNHLDNNPLNNKSSNLEWCTQKENVNYSINKGHSNPKKAGLKGLNKRWKNEQ